MLFSLESLARLLVFLSLIYAVKEYEARDRPLVVVALSTHVCSIGGVFKDTSYLGELGGILVLNHIL